MARSAASPETAFQGACAPAGAAPSRPASSAAARSKASAPRITRGRSDEQPLERALDALAVAVAPVPALGLQVAGAELAEHLGLLQPLARLVHVRARAEPVLVPVLQPR